MVPFSYAIPDHMTVNIEVYIAGGAANHLFPMEHGPLPHILTLKIDMRVYRGPIGLWRTSFRIGGYLIICPLPGEYLEGCISIFYY